MLAFDAWFYKYVHIRSYLEDTFFKSMWLTVTLWYFRHYIFMYSSSLCWKPVLLNYLNNFHNYFAFIHNAYVFDWVIINVTKYSNPEYFENITLGSALHRRADILPPVIHFCLYVGIFYMF